MCYLVYELLVMACPCGDTWLLTLERMSCGPGQTTFLKLKAKWWEKSRTPIKPDYTLDFKL